MQWAERYSFNWSLASCSRRLQILNWNWYSRICRSLWKMLLYFLFSSIWLDCDDVEYIRDCGIVERRDEHGQCLVVLCRRIIHNRCISSFRRRHVWIAVVHFSRRFAEIFAINHCRCATSKSFSRIWHCKFEFKCFYAGIFDFSLKIIQRFPCLRKKSQRNTPINTIKCSFLLNSPYRRWRLSAHITWCSEILPNRALMGNFHSFLNSKFARS